MEVVVSAALPKFSIENHAVAVWPGRPSPLVLAVPSGPSMSSPRVRRTSTGIRTEALDSGSFTRSTVTSNHPSSSPSAVLGTFRSHARVVLVPEARLNWVLEDTKVSDQPEGKSSSDHAACHVASLVPVDITSTSIRSLVPGRTFGVSTGPLRSTA